MIEEQGERILIDGVCVSDANEVSLERFGALASGVVLEVGLGHGRLHSQLTRNFDISRHYVIEESEEVVERARELEILSPAAEILIGRVPEIPFSAVCDWIYLDIPGARELAILAWAARILRERGGAIVYGS